MSNKACEFSGNIASVRAVEDCIRATKKYTEGIRTIRKAHPIQGAEFPSKMFCKFYEVSPHTDISWDMPAGTAIDWLWGDVLLIDVTFTYDYRVNKASVSVADGPVAVQELTKTIPGFGNAIKKVVAGGNGRKGKG